MEGETVAELARRQHGVVSTAQRNAIRLGPNAVALHAPANGSGADGSGFERRVLT